MPGQLIGALFELRVGEAVAFEGNCQGVGVALRLFFNEFVDAFISWVAALRSVPVLKNLLELRIVENRQAVDLLAGVGNQAFQESFKMAQPAPDRFAVE